MISLTVLAFMSLSVAVVFATSYGQQILNILSLSTEAINHPQNPAPLETVSLSTQGIKHPKNPYPLETMSLSVSAIVEGAVTPPQPPFTPSDLMASTFPWMLIIGLAAIAIIMIRGRR